MGFSAIRQKCCVLDFVVLSRWIIYYHYHPEKVCLVVWSHCMNSSRAAQRLWEICKTLVTECFDGAQKGPRSLQQAGAKSYPLTLQANDYWKKEQHSCRFTFGGKPVLLSQIQLPVVILMIRRNRNFCNVVLVPNSSICYSRFKSVVCCNILAARQHWILASTKMCYNFITRCRMSFYSRVAPYPWGLKIQINRKPYSSHFNLNACQV